jgi:hypothetical protein
MYAFFNHTVVTSVPGTTQVQCHVCDISVLSAANIIIYFSSAVQLVQFTPYTDTVLITI